MELAGALLVDARQAPVAERLLHRALRQRPLETNALRHLGDLRWNEGRFDDATEFYRFAANLEGFRESLYQAWFVACRRTRHTEVALEHLEDRFQRFGQRSGQPALTLAWAWCELDQPERARTVLARSLELRPDDGHLALRAATLAASLTLAGEAQTLLARARGRVRDVDWLRAAAEIAEAGLDTVETLRLSRELLAFEPLALDLHRGVARSLARLEGHQAALAHLRDACGRFPHHHALRLLGHILARVHQPAEARVQLRRAIALSADNTAAISTLLELAEDDTQRRGELAFVEEQLITQVVTGDGLLRFQEIARAFLPPESLLQVLRRVHTERPDLWHAWSALISQLDHLGQSEEALGLAREAAERFPHLPAVWLDLGAIHRTRHEAEPEIAATRRAFEINPAWSRATLALTDALERAGNLEESGRVFEQALRHSPHEAPFHGGHGHLLWRLGRSADAFQTFERALRLAPGYDWAWGFFQSAATQAGEADRVADFARRLSVESPGDSRGWLRVARILEGPGTLPERLAAAEQARRLAPSAFEPIDLTAELLIEAERFEEAAEMCRAGLNHVTDHQRLDPTDPLTSQRLFDLRLEAGDLDGAATTLVSMQAHVPGARTITAEVRLALRRGDLAAAAMAYAQLLRLPDPDPRPVQQATQAFEEAGQAAAALQHLLEALNQRQFNPQAPSAAIRLLILRGHPGRARRIFLGLEDPEATQRAACVLAHGLAETGDRIHHRWALWRRREVFQRHDAAWAEVGFLLVRRGRSAAAARWLADWRQRASVPPWALFNLCLSLRELGRYREAHTVACHVAETWGHREGAHDFDLFLALEEGLAGNGPAAACRLETVTARDDNVYDQHLLTIARALASFLETPREDRRARFRGVRQTLAKVFTLSVTCHAARDVRQTLRRAGRRFAREGAGVGARLWFGWRLYWAWSFLPLAIPAVLLLAAAPGAVLLLLGFRVLCSLLRNK